MEFTAVGRLKMASPDPDSYSSAMRPLRYSINVTLDGCVDHREILADQDGRRYWAEKLAQTDALLLGLVNYQMIEDAWRSRASETMADWTQPLRARLML